MSIASLCIMFITMFECECECECDVIVCVCVCVRERERECVCVRVWRNASHCTEIRKQLGTVVSVCVHIHTTWL